MLKDILKAFLLLLIICTIGIPYVSIKALKSLFDDVDYGDKYWTNQS